MFRVIRRHLNRAGRHFGRTIGSVHASSTASSSTTPIPSSNASVDLERILKNAARKADLKTIKATLSSHERNTDISLHQKVLSALSWRGHAKQCVNWISYMAECNVAADAGCYTAVVNAFSSQGNLDEAEKYFNLIDPHDRDVVAYGAMIKACIQADNISRAEFYFNQMRGQGLVPNGHVYSQIISYFARQADADTAVPAAFV